MQKRILFMAIFLLFALLVSVLSGCGTQKKYGKEKPEEEIQRTIITDPNGVMFTVNDWPVTKTELEAQIEVMKPPENFSYAMALFKYFMPKYGFKNQFEKENKQLLDEVKGIMEKVKSGELTFEDAILKYSDTPGKEATKGFMKDQSQSKYYTFDKYLFSLNEGEMSEPFFTPLGINVVKIDKVYKDYYGEKYSVDLYLFLISYSKFLKEGETPESYYTKVVSGAKIKILNDSFAKEIPELSLLGKSPEEQQKIKGEIDKWGKSDHTWKTLPPETPLFSINDNIITKKEFEEIARETSMPKRDIYNRVISNYLLPSKSIIGYFKPYHEEIIKELNDIKAKIEKGEITFEDAQQKFSTDPGKAQEGGLYRGIKKGQFMKEFEDVMFSIPLNQISDPFLTSFGGHILKVENETLDKDGKRDSVDVRHILLGYEKYLKKNKASDKPLNFDTAREEAMKNLKVKIYDAYIYSILPNLGKPFEIPLESEQNKEEPVEYEDEPQENAEGQGS